MDSIEKAIEELSDAEVVRLQRFGDIQLVGCRFRSGEIRNGTDCLQEAITRTLEGKRIWKPNKVNFFTHLLGAIRSIGDHWRKQARRGQLLDLLIHREAETKNQEHHRYYEIVDRLRQLFSEDQEVLHLIHLHLHRYTGPEIQKQLQIGPQEYETRMKRLYRKARKSKVL
jgi:hypothetical protein